MSYTEIKVFFDTEFTGLRNGAKLISIGCIIGTKTFYAESTEWLLDEENIDDNTMAFLKKEVIPGLVYYNGLRKCVNDDFDTFKNNVSMIGSEEKIARELVKFMLASIPEEIFEKVVFVPVSDVMYYDMVLFNDLMNRALKQYDLKHECDARDVIISPYGIDICDMIRLCNHMSAYEAFDVNREELLDKLDPLNNREFFPIRKHNSLYDARIIKSIYDAYVTKYRCTSYKSVTKVTND